jgi:uncharacterized membrane protein
MKTIAVAILLPVFAGCVSIDLPGVVSDTAKVTKDAYRSVTGKKPDQELAKGAGAASDTVSNTYIGKESQSVAEIRQACVTEAATKLFAATGKEVPYSIVENAISSVGNAVTANCKLSAVAPPPPAPPKT